MLQSKNSRAAAILGVSMLFWAPSAKGEQRTFHLDRLEIPGGPDDGVAIIRPIVQSQPLFFGQISQGFSLNPLRTINVTGDYGTLDRSWSVVVNYQLTSYVGFGFSFLKRVIVGASMPITEYQYIRNPAYGIQAPFGFPKQSSSSQTGQSIGDVRLDARVLVAQTKNQRVSFAVQTSVFVPTGTTVNFGGNGWASVMGLTSLEVDLGPVAIVANLGVHIRPRITWNDPVHNSGLGIGNEARAGLGVFVPIGRQLRLGVSAFGQTGIQKDSVVGNTIFTARNSPLEWMGEARYSFGGGGRWWVAATGGSVILSGYGASDFRSVLQLGASVPLFDVDRIGPNPKPEPIPRDPDNVDDDSDDDSLD